LEEEGYLGSTKCRPIPREVDMRRSAVVGALITALSSLIIASCAEPPPPEPFLVSVRVESDPGKPISGANIARANKLLGTTDPAGRASLKIGGVEGEITDVVVTCPEGFQTPNKPINIRLTRLAEKSKIPEYAVQCPPSMRRVVVAVRAENGPHLPVMYLNQPVTRTDAAGAASFALEVPPGSQFTVALSTMERKDMKPLSPSKLFVVNQQDDVFLFDQKFEVEKKKVYVAPPPRIARAL
jgi:hypothetical protein